MSPFDRFSVQIDEPMTLPEAIQHAAAEFSRDRRPWEAFVSGLFRDVQTAKDVLQAVWVCLANRVQFDD